MNTVKYGDWVIAVDIEKTKEYYKNFKRIDNQANRNFSEYCNIMSDEEKSFFDSFGITPECCAINHIGVDRKKRFPCGGYYLICGEYLKYPKEELITIEELAENDFIDERDDPHIDVGIFQFDFQREGAVICDIPEDMPEGFICVRFWCENMRWILDEKPAPDMIMYEPPRVWEIGKIIKEKIREKKQQAQDFEDNKQEFINVFENLGIKYYELSKKEIEDFRRNWIESYSPEDANKKEIRELCLSSRKYTPYLWHIFSFEFLSSEETPKECYDKADKSSCVVISNFDDIGFAVSDADKLSSAVIDEFVDVTISSKDFSWTYCKTHEEMLGPYFYKE